MTTNKKAADLTRDELLAMLTRFAGQRPGIDPRNYHDASSYRAESRQVTQDWHDFQALRLAVQWREGITADDMRAALMNGGRLSLSEDGRLEYCTGQYFPTEYRKAACRVLASLLWAYFRECEAMATTPTPEGRRVGGDDIRRVARRKFGRRIASRYFN